MDHEYVGRRLGGAAPASAAVAPDAAPSSAAVISASAPSPSEVRSSTTAAAATFAEQWLPIRIFMLIWIAHYTGPHEAAWKASWACTCVENLRTCILPTPLTKQVRWVNMTWSPPSQRRQAASVTRTRFKSIYLQNVCKSPPKTFFG